MVKYSVLLLQILAFIVIFQLTIFTTTLAAPSNTGIIFTRFTHSFNNINQKYNAIELTPPSFEVIDVNEENFFFSPQVVSLTHISLNISIQQQKEQTFTIEIDVPFHNSLSSLLRAACDYFTSIVNSFWNNDDLQQQDNLINYNLLQNGQIPIQPITRVLPSEFTTLFDEMDTNTIKVVGMMQFTIDYTICDKYFDFNYHNDCIIQLQNMIINTNPTTLTFVNFQPIGNNNNNNGQLQNNISTTLAIAHSIHHIPGYNNELAIVCETLDNTPQLSLVNDVNESFDSNNDDNNIVTNENHEFSQLSMEIQQAPLPSHPLSVETIQSHILEHNSMFYTTLNISSTLFNNLPTTATTYEEWLATYRETYPTEYNNTQRILGLESSITILLEGMNSKDTNLNHELFRKSYLSLDKGYGEALGQGDIRKQQLALLTLNGFNYMPFDIRNVNLNETTDYLEGPKVHFVLPFYYDSFDIRGPEVYYTEDSTQSVTREMFEHTFFTETMTLRYGFNTAYHFTPTNKLVFNDTYTYGPSRFLTLAIPLKPFGGKAPESADDIEAFKLHVYITLRDTTTDEYLPTIHHEEVIKWENNDIPQNTTIVSNLTKLEVTEQNVKPGPFGSFNVVLPDYNNTNINNNNITAHRIKYNNYAYQTTLNAYDATPQCKGYGLIEKCDLQQICPSNNKNCDNWEWICWWEQVENPNIIMNTTSSYCDQVSCNIEFFYNRTNDLIINNNNGDDNSTVVHIKSPNIQCNNLAIYNSFINNKKYFHYKKAPMYDFRDTAYLHTSKNKKYNKQNPSSGYAAYRLNNQGNREVILGRNALKTSFRTQLIEDAFNILQTKGIQLYTALSSASSSFEQNILNFDDEQDQNNNNFDITAIDDGNGNEWVLTGYTEIGKKWGTRQPPINIALIFGLVFGLSFGIPVLIGLCLPFWLIMEGERYDPCCKFYCCCLCLGEFCCCYVSDIEDCCAPCLKCCDLMFYCECCDHTCPGCVSECCQECCIYECLGCDDPTCCACCDTSTTTPGVVATSGTSAVGGTGIVVDEAVVYGKDGGQPLTKLQQRKLQAKHQREQARAQRKADLTSKTTTPATPAPEVVIMGEEEPFAPPAQANADGTHSYMNNTGLGNPQPDGQPAVELAPYNPYGNNAPVIDNNNAQNV